jgi:hypothetical protein
MRIFCVFIIQAFFLSCSNYGRGALEHTAFTSTTSAGVGAGVGAVVGNQLGLVGEGAGVGAGAGLMSGLVLGSQLDNLAYRQEILERKLAAIDNHLSQQRNFFELNFEKNLRGALEYEPKIVDVYFEPGKSDIPSSFKPTLEAICSDFKQLNFPATVGVELKVREGKSFNQDMMIAKSRLDNIRTFLRGCGIDKSLLEDKIVTVQVKPLDNFESNQARIMVIKGLAIKEQ